MKLSFSKKTWKFFFTIILLLAVIFISSRGADNPVKGFVLTLASPFLKTFRIFSGGTAGFLDFLGSIGNLKTENENLVRENMELLAENVRLKDIDAQNQELRRELDLLPRRKFELEASFVIAQDPREPGSSILIDKGESSGLKEGMPLIVANGILVGKISQAYPSAAKAVLLTDPASAVNAEIQDSGAKGIAKGEYGLGLKMDMVSQTEVIKEGDIVMTSGLGGEMPRGLLVGKIDKVFQSEDKLFQQATIIPAADVSDLKVVFAIKNF